MAQQAALNINKALFVVLLEPAQRVAELPYWRPFRSDAGSSSDTSVVGTTSDSYRQRQRRQHWRQRFQHFVEAVHVELANKQRHVAVLEIARQRRGELLIRVEQKRVVVGVIFQPPNQV